MFIKGYSKSSLLFSIFYCALFYMQAIGNIVTTGSGLVWFSAYNHA